MLLSAAQSRLLWHTGVRSTNVSPKHCKLLQHSAVNSGADTLGEFYCQQLKAHQQLLSSRSFEATHLGLSTTVGFDFLLLIAITPMCVADLIYRNLRAYFAENRQINIKPPLDKMVALQIIIEEKSRDPNGIKTKHFTKVSTQKSYQWATGGKPLRILNLKYLPSHCIKTINHGL